MQGLSFFKNLSLLLLLNLLIKPVWIFAIDRAVQNSVGYEVYGQYFALLNFCLVFYFLADAGISNLINQRLASGASVSVQQLSFFKLVMLLLYTVVCYTAARAAGVAVHAYFGTVLFIQLLNSAFVFLRSIITAQQLFGADAWFSIVDKGLMVLLCAGPLYMPDVFGSISLDLFLKLQLLATSTAVLAALVYLKSRNIEWRTGSRNSKALLHQLLPFALIILLMSAHYRSDGFLLERWHHNGAYQAGLYAAAYRLLDAANMVGYLAASFLVPFIARHQHQQRLLNQTIAAATQLLLAVGIAVSSFCWVYASWLQQLLYRQQAGLPEVMQLCLAVLPAYLLTHIYGSVLTATARLRQFLAVLAVAVFINLLLNAWLIPLYGAKGAATAALVSQYTCAAGCILAVRKQLTIQPGSFAMHLVAAALYILLFSVAKRLNWNVWASVAFAFILAGALAYTQKQQIKKWLSESSI